jgi:hypothetical protein
MRNIFLALWSIFLLPGMCLAAVDPECLKHLGGAFADVECFKGLSNALQVENKKVLRQVRATIPPGNRNDGLLNRYAQEQLNAKKYCELSRYSLTEWVAEQNEPGARYAYVDAAYYECIYENLAHQHRFLK